eukprot:COSAG01_NODE_70465_length_258_cov_0.981132_1_plen_63_part_01
MSCAPNQWAGESRLDSTGAEFQKGGIVWREWSVSAYSANALLSPPAPTLTVANPLVVLYIAVQ